MPSLLSHWTTLALLGLSASASYFYSCEGECSTGCESKKLNPLFNNVDWFTTQILRCATHSFNSTLKANFDQTIKAVRCKDTRRAYFTFAPGMEDFWTFSAVKDLKVNTYWLGHHESQVKTYFTNDLHPCTTTDLNDEWPWMSSSDMRARGKKIGYNTMVFTGLNDDFVKNVESITAYFDLRVERLATYQENSWYQCEAGCCLRYPECSNSQMRNVVALPSFMDQCDKCVSEHPDCKFTMSRQLERSFAVGQVYICSGTDLSFPLNLTSPYFNPPLGSQIRLDLNPPAVSFDTLRAYIAFEDQPCIPYPTDNWAEISQIGGLYWQFTKLQTAIPKSLYTVVQFDHYKPYDLLTLSMPVRFGTLPDDK